MYHQLGEWINTFTALEVRFADRAALHVGQLG
jgi:hypothetical protein